MTDAWSAAFLDGIDAPVTDVFTPLGYSPNARQKIFHEMSQERTSAILYGGSAGSGKLLKLSELIPTPSGFTKLVDIGPGDSVFGRDGLVYPVLAESEVQFVEGYEFTLSDGTTIESNDEHLWLTYTQKELGQLLRRTPEFRAKRQAKRPSRAVDNPEKGAYQASVTAQNNRDREYKYLDPPAGSVRTTAEIVETLNVRGDRTNHAIPTCSPLQMPEAHLPLDPYLLGCWLGDGHSNAGSITGMDDEIHDAFEAAGFPLAHIGSKPDNRAVTCRYEGLGAVLKKMGLLKNKHVPDEYLWASYGQRLAVLQGLMDTDGCANKNGSSEFCSTLQHLAESVAFLARTMGIQASVNEGRAKLYGKDCGPKWTVLFTTDQPVFRLNRKLERLHKVKPTSTAKWRYIVSARRVEAQPMKCLKVGSPDELFLVTENFVPTHNSSALTMEAIHCAVNFPGMRIGCIRRSYPELEESFLAELAKRKYAEPFGARYNQSDHILKFPNGSIINFTFAGNEQDASRLLGGEYQLFCIDEAGQMPPTVLQHIEERLRSGTRGLPVIGFRAATNPGGVSTKYLKDRFINPTKNGKTVHVDEFGRKNAFIPARYTDNPHIDAGYERVLNSIPDPQRRAAMRDGDWSAMVGAFFSTFSAVRHAVPRFELPKEWRRYAGIDYGSLAPFACVWAAVDNDGRLWVYREAYVAGLDAPNQARLILDTERLNGDGDVIRVADPSMWGNHGTPLSIADMYGLEGCGIAPANNDRLNGWARMHWYFNDAHPCEYHASLGWEKCPLLHVFDEECPNFMETIPSLPRSKTKPDDAETANVADHIPDACRYLVMAVGTHSRPILYDDLPSAEAVQAHQDLIERAYHMPDQDTSNLVAGKYSGDLGLDSYLARQ